MGIAVVTMVLVAALAVSVEAWPGHDWEVWRQTTQWTLPDLKTDQKGRRDLAPLLETAGADGKQGRIDEIRGWEARRSAMAGVVGRILGEPNSLKKPTLECQFLGEEVLSDHIRRHIRIRSEPDDWIPAYLLLPREMPPGRLPTMICLHQTVPQGKLEACGIKGSEDLAFALELVRRGYVCIAPDVIGFGERIPLGEQPYHNSIAFYKRHPRWSFMGKMIWDVSRVIDYLETLPCVDPLMIGSIGHSHGAYGTLFAAAFEPRISLAIASCGFTTFRSDPSPQRWSHGTALIPQLGMYLPDAAKIPFDWQHICAMIAPRSLYVWYTTKDSIFPKTENLEGLFGDVRGVYGLYGASDELCWKSMDAEHRFPKEAREAAYGWLSERFFRVGDIHKVPADMAGWESRRRVIERLVRRMMGTARMVPPQPDVKILGSESLPKYERRLIEYSVEEGERVRAYLCVPKAQRKGTPGVLVLHQTTREGKKESVGLAGLPSLAFAAELSDRGYITLSPDSITTGERVDAYGAFDTRGHYLRHPDLSAMGKMLYDAQRALDVLVNVENVDARRIGAIGHSLGSEEAMVVAAFDDRVQAAIASCGYATFGSESPEGRLRWARDHWFSYMPKLRPVFLQGRLPHWDWQDVVRLIAPRGYLQHATEKDEIFPTGRSAYEAAEAGQAVWALYGKPDRLKNLWRPGGHGITAQTRQEAYEWLDRVLDVEQGR